MSPTEGAAATRPPAVWIALIGPPGSGKSTVSATLADRLGLQVWRVRDAARRRTQVDERLRARLAATGGGRGRWLPLPLVVQVLEADVGEGTLAAGATVLEGFPGHGGQARLLVDLARRHGNVQLAGVELRVGDPVALRRIAGRRVCPGCEGDPTGDPHLPAYPDDVGRCSACAGALAVRPSDMPAAARGRLARYRRTVGGVRLVLTGAGARWDVVDGEEDPAEVAAETAAILAGLPRPVMNAATA